MNREKFNKAYEIHDAIETLKTIQLDVLDHNRSVAIEIDDEVLLHLPGLLYVRFAEWVQRTREELEKEFERV